MVESARDGRDNRVLEMVVHDRLHPAAVHLSGFVARQLSLSHSGAGRARVAHQIAIWDLLACRRRCAMKKALNDDRQRCLRSTGGGLQSAAASAIGRPVLCSQIRDTATWTMGASALRSATPE